MDTDELSTEIYKAIFIEAEKLSHDLTLQFGLLADSCNGETDYIESAKKLITEIKTLNKAELSYMFFGSPPPENKLLLKLDMIMKNIAEVEKIPPDKRHYDF